MTYTPKHLKRWTLPRDYAGAQWPEYFVVYCRRRDSDLLTESNWHQILEALGADTIETTEETNVDPIVIPNESHWAVGWVEWIGIHESRADLLEIADNLKQRLEDYPILNEADFSERESNAAFEWWQNMGLRGRVDACRECGISIFAARRVDDMPSDDYGRLHEYLVRS